MMPTEPVPPDPAVTTTVKFARPGHGVPFGSGVPGLEPVRFSESSDVNPTSGMVPAATKSSAGGLRPTPPSAATT